VRKSFSLVILVIVCSGLLSQNIRTLQNEWEEGTNLLENSGFEEGSGGMPSSWSGYAPSGAELSWDRSVSHQGQACISIINVDESNRNPIIWRQHISAFPAKRELMLTGYIKTQDLCSTGIAAICIRVVDTHDEVIGFATTQQTDGFEGTHNWTVVNTVVVASEEGVEVQVLAFMVGTGHVWFDDIYLVVGKEAEPESFPARGGMEGPGIAHAYGQFQIMARKDISSPQIAFPIPLAFADQVPIYFEIRSQPENVLKDVVFTQRDEYNWIAELTFCPLDTGDCVDVEWDCYVLIREHDYSDLPEYVELPLKEELPEDVLHWLESTVCVQVDHPEIQEKAKDIRGESTNLMEIARKTAEFLGTIEQGHYRSLDAVEALHEGGSCTSYANLAAALLRANGIPTRILAVYPTWAPSLVTHYIVEFYVPEYGWVRFESTLGEIPWEPYRDVVVAVVTPEDENRSFEQGRWAARGVPWLSLTENSTGPSLYYEGTLDEEIGCDHGAESVIIFEEKVEEAFTLTWSVWNAYLESKIQGREISQAVTAQKGAANSSTIDIYIQRMRKARTLYTEESEEPESEPEEEASTSVLLVLMGFLM